MKHLTIRYGDLTLFDGNIDELVFTDSDTGIRVEGRLKKTAPTGMGLLDLISAAAKPKQEDPADG